MAGFVSIVGAGPWDPGLLTLAAVTRLQRADVVIADYLVNPAHLVHAPPQAQIIQREAGPRSGARLTQDRVNELMVAHARAGQYVVRLKGGDPMMFGRGAEEADHLRTHGVEFEFIPGVSSPIAAPESAGIPVTHRDHTPAVTFVSGYEAYEKAGLTVAWRHLARSAGTLVFLMGVRNAAENMNRLVEAGRDGGTPAAAIRWGTRGVQETLVATVGTIAEEMRKANLRAPAIIVVGEVVAMRERIQWMERRPLFGRRVVVTRATGQSGALVQQLAELGADAVAFPCLALAPPEDPGPLNRLAERLAPADVVVVSSPNGARALHQALMAANLDARALAGKTLCAIGTGTATALAHHGLRADLIPEQARAEGLVQALQGPGREDRLGGHVLHLRATEGRDVLRRAVTEAGGHYELVPAYKTIRPGVPEALLRSLQPVDAGGEGVDAVCFASGRAAKHFLEILGERFSASEVEAILAGAKVITIGPVTTAAVEALGLTVDTTATEPSDAGLARAVRELLTRAG